MAWEPAHLAAPFNLSYCERAGLHLKMRSFSSRKNNYASQMDAYSGTTGHVLATLTSTAQAPSDSRNGFSALVAFIGLAASEKNSELAVLEEKTRFMEQNIS